MRTLVKVSGEFRTLLWSISGLTLRICQWPKERCWLECCSRQTVMIHWIILRMRWTVVIKFCKTWWMIRSWAKQKRINMQLLPLVQPTTMLIILITITHISLMRLLMRRLTNMAWRNQKSWTMGTRFIRHWIKRINKTCKMIMRPVGWTQLVAIHKLRQWSWMRKLVGYVP